MCRLITLIGKPLKLKLKANTILYICVWFLLILQPVIGNVQYYNKAEFEILNDIMSNALSKTL